MQPATYYKTSRLAAGKQDAMSWLAGRLAWERTLRRLRSKEADRPARRAA